MVTPSLAWYSCAFRTLAVGVEVDEARRQHESGGVDQDATVGERVGQGFLRQGGDHVAADTDVPDLVEPPLGVDDAGALEDDVELPGVGLAALVGGRVAAHEEKRGKERDRSHCR